ncbi:MAG: type II toxin-antitoxin system prevent-host-death family antitoxin [Spirochaetes bacterium]|nr:type II toxin-antitoxin system prevent-host-death family antitoxin [Spirochaetota bacterium]
MEISAKQLRDQPGRIISLVNSGQNITVTYRGKPSAKIVPIMKKQAVDIAELESEDMLFGLWKNKKDISNVDLYVRNMRKGRNFDN